MATKARPAKARRNEGADTIEVKYVTIPHAELRARWGKFACDLGSRMTDENLNLAIEILSQCARHKALERERGQGRPDTGAVQAEEVRLPQPTRPGLNAAPEPPSVADTYAALMRNPWPALMLLASQGAAGESARGQGDASTRPSSRRRT
jgi:hypothetical protein